MAADRKYFVHIAYNEARESHSAEPFFVGFPRKERLFMSDRIRGYGALNDFLRLRVWRLA